MNEEQGTTACMPRAGMISPLASESDGLNVSDVGDSPCGQRSDSHSVQKNLFGQNTTNPSPPEQTYPRYLNSTLPSHTGFRPAQSRKGHREAEKCDLKMMTVSSATISNLLKGVETKMMSEFSVMQKENLEEVRKIADSINCSISTHMRHMEGVLMISRGMTGTRTQRSGGKTTLTAWEQKLNSLTCDVEVIFNKEVLSRILSFNSCVKVTSVYRNHDGSDVEKAALSAHTVLFSLQPGEKKFSFSGKVGGLHSEFKFITVQNAFFNVSRNAFGFFEDAEISQQDQESYKSLHGREKNRVVAKHCESSSAAGSKQIKRPIWLEKGKVNSDHINEARGFLERAIQSRKKEIRQTPGPDDIATHAALRVYRLLGKFLHVRRGAVRNKFFQELGYLLVRWSDHVQDGMQEDMKMSWKIEDSGLNLSLDSIPCTEQCNINADESTITAVDAGNKILLRRLFSNFPAMVLAVEHQIHVVNGSGTQRRHVGGEITSIHRLINLIDVACDVCVEYCAVGSIEVFLRAHRYAVQSVMVLALLFKAFCVKFMECRRNNEGRAACSVPADFDVVAPTEMTVGGMSLKDFIPGPSTQKNLLECRCLRMTHSEFNMFNHG